jgi:hypothetical protein
MRQNRGSCDSFSTPLWDADQLPMHIQFWQKIRLFRPQLRETAAADWVQSELATVEAPQAAHLA